MTRTQFDRDPAPGEVLVQLSFPHSNIDGACASLTITDEMSGQQLVAIRMDSEQFLTLMSNTATRIPGATLPAHPDRIGRRVVTDSTSLGRSPEQTPEQVRDAYLADGWEAVSIQPTNFGHRVVARRWIDPSTQEG